MAGSSSAADVGSSAPTALLAGFVTGWKPDPIPARALHEAQRALLDFLGVALVGTPEASSRIAAGIARREGAVGPAVVVGHGFRSSASFAAFVNGVSGHALDYDPSATVKTTGHPVVCVVPAALAAAEEVDASGSELLEAIIVGFEVVSRIGRSAGGDRGHHYTSGFHGTSVFGIFGATAAACRLLRLDAEATGRAFGIAASGPKGLRVNYGTMSKPLHAGEASRAGVIAAMLANNGFTAAGDAIEGRFGWASAVVADSFAPDQLTTGLGQALAIEQGVNFKRFPSCGASHASIRATLRVMSENGLRPEDVDEIEVSLGRDALEKTLTIPWPQVPLEGKFCAPYVVAASWADGRVDVDTFTDDKLRALAPYRDRVTVRGIDGRPPVTALARTVDGRELVHTERGNYFSDESGAQSLSLSDLSDDELRQKFRDNVGVVRPAERADALLDQLDRLAHERSLSELAELLL